MRGFVHHIDLTVKNRDISRPFYEAVLGFMGYRFVKDTETGYDFELEIPGGATASVVIRNAWGPHAGRLHNRYSAGLHHLAWRAASREDVGQMYAMLKQIGATILDPPAEYPRYRPGYYAVFFADPDGLKLEYVYTPPGP
jgi:glyoxylase I family protein